MSEIEDIADTCMEFDKLHVDLGKLDVVKSHTDGQDMSEELLGTVLATDISKSGMAHSDGRIGSGIDSFQVSSSSHSHTWHLFGT